MKKRIITLIIIMIYGFGITYSQSDSIDINWDNSVVNGLDGLNSATVIRKNPDSSIYVRGGFDGHYFHSANSIVKLKDGDQVMEYKDQ